MMCVCVCMCASKEVQNHTQDTCALPPQRRAEVASRLHVVIGFFLQEHFLSEKNCNEKTKKGAL